MMKNDDKKMLEVIDDLRGAYSRYARWNDVGGNEDHATDAFREVLRLAGKLDTLVWAEHSSRTEQKMSPLPDYGEHMTMEEFVECCKCGGAIRERAEKHSVLPIPNLLKSSEGEAS